MGGLTRTQQEAVATSLRLFGWVCVPPEATHAQKLKALGITPRTKTAPLTPEAKSILESRKARLETANAEALKIQRETLARKRRQDRERKLRNRKSTE